MAGDADAVGDLRRGAQQLDIVAHRRRRVEDGALAQPRLVRADPLGVTAAEVVVDEGTGAALGVVDDRDLEERPLADRPFGELGDEGDVLDHRRRDPAAGIAEHQRVAQVEAEEVRRVGPRVDAGDDEEAELGEDDRPLVPAARREVTIAPECLLDSVTHPVI